MDHFEKLQAAASEGKISKNLADIIRNFYISYGEAVEENGFTIKKLQATLSTFLDLVIAQLEHPYVFAPYHEHIITPFDYYHFGLDLLRPLVIFDKSKVDGIEHIDAMEKAMAKGENVILLANHQTEPDPQAISLLLEKTHPKFAENMIFVAGRRVISDPLAVPLSMGRNLLCIYSKRHMESDPEQKQENLTHNQRTMKMMSNLLKEGGKCIYVAPSGGRDRRDANGNIAIAPFDPQSVEMFWLMAQHAGKKSHFHTLTLATYDLLPPPSSIEKELGERRQAHSTPIHLAFGKEVDMENFPGSDSPGKTQRRQNRADYLWKLVADKYGQLTQS